MAPIVGNPLEPSSHLFRGGSLKLRISGRICNEIKADITMLFVHVSCETSYVLLLTYSVMKKLMASFPDAVGAWLLEVPALSICRRSCLRGTAIPPTFSPDTCVNSTCILNRYSSSLSLKTRKCQRVCKVT